MRAGTLDRRILALAVPAAGSAMLHIVHRAVDMYWLGRLGTQALASLTVFSLVRIPMALLAVFSLGLGVDGIWWAITIASVLRGVFVTGWFSRGTWKTRSV